VNSFEGTSFGDYYATRIRGYLIPPTTGNYTFWIASDDDSRLFLSTDANPTNLVEIANIPEGAVTNPYEWTLFPSQQSAVISLTAGVPYYIEAIFSEFFGPDFVAVAWQGPGISQQVIPGAYLSPGALPCTASSTPTPTDTPVVPPTNTATPTATTTVNMTGNILREMWYGLGGFGGDALADLTSDPRYPNAPNDCFYETVFDTPFNQGDSYGQRMRAYLVPPATGDYTFWITSDNRSNLYLSSDANPANAVVIASVDPFVYTPYDYEEFSSQQSTPITLTAGQLYYIEAVHTEGVVTDFLRVAWDGPTLATRTTIAGTYLTTDGMTCTPVANTPTPTATATSTATSTTTPTATPTSSGAGNGTMCVEGSSSAASGTLYDSGGATGNYNDFENCSFLVQPGASGVLELTFAAFATEAGFDVLSVYDGADASGVFLGSYSGSTLPRTLYATSGSAYIEFTSDFSITEIGYQINWNLVPQGSSYYACTALTSSTLSSGTLYDSGGPTGGYLNNETCGFLINPGLGGTIQLVFAQFQTEANYDRVLIYDGTSDAAPLIGDFSGSGLPPQVDATSGAIYIVFTSDDSVTRAGFQANWTRVGL
jgi:hypothetical protein